MSVLTKSELIDLVASETGATKKLVAEILESTQKNIIDSVADGKEVKLTGFAAFGSQDRAARRMKNPRTGEDMDVPEARMVKIRPLSQFRDTVRNTPKN